MGVYSNRSIYIVAYNVILCREAMYQMMREDGTVHAEDVLEMLDAVSLVVMCKPK